MNIFYNHFTPSFGFMLACLRQFFNGNKDVLAYADYLTQADWDKFVQLVSWHKLTPIIYPILKQQSSIPETVLSKIRLHYHANAERMMVLTAELFRITKIFNHANIFNITSKGPLIAKRLYDNFVMRESRDIDILISPDNLLCAHTLLLESGYQRIYPEVLTAKQYHAYVRYKNDFVYYQPTRHIILELHWRFFDHPLLFNLPVDALINHHRTQIVSGVLVRTLADQDEFLYLLAHGSTSCWFRLFWLCDVMQWIKRYPIVHWVERLAYAKQLGVQRMLMETYLMMHYLFEHPLPHCIETMISQNKAVFSLFQSSLAVLRFSSHPFSSPGKMFMRHIMLHDAWQNRFHFIKHRFSMSPSDWKSFHMPDALFFLYAILRPFTGCLRMIKRFVLGWWQRFWCRKKS